MPLFPLPVFWFGYFDGFKTGSRLCNQSCVPRNPSAVSLDSSGAKGCWPFADHAAKFMIGMLFNRNNAYLFWKIEAEHTFCVGEIFSVI